ncbi:stalk domain-containing protein [Cohnella faecalis]|nr:stalk domain-containing protein [Cohnella faecalis]
MIIPEIKVKWEKYVLTMLIAAVIAIGMTFSAASADASSDRVVTDGHTPEEIIAKWDEYKPTFSGDPFLVKPNVTAPYATGKLNPAFIQDGVNMANFVRFLAGLPDDLEQDQSLNDQAQYGAVVLAAVDTLTHYPAKPKDMDSGFFEIGAKSTSSSNLHAGLTKLHQTVLGYMSDSDSTNIDRVGHRRWILNPPLKKVGFGYALSNTATAYSPMQVFDKSGAKTSASPITAWPSPGAFPMIAFDFGDAWSVNLNKEQYESPTLNEVKVNLKRITDGREWNFDYNDKGSPDMSRNYFNVEGSGFGAGSSIIFRPADAGAPSDQDVYEVKIEGIKTISGEAATISYTVSFFDIPGKDNAAEYLAQWRLPREAKSQLPIKFKSSTVEQWVRLKLGINQAVITEAALSRISDFYFDYNNGDTSLDEDILPKLTGLRSLNFQSLGEAGVAPIANLRGLTELSVATSFAEKPIHELQLLANLKQLNKLSLYGSIPEGDLSQLLGQLPNLRQLTVEDDQLTDLSFIPPTVMANLVELTVTSDGLRDVTALRYANKLLNLSLQGNDVPLLDLRPITSLSGLLWLGVNSFGITDADVVKISRMTGLTTLSLRNNQIRDISPIAALTKLEDINVSGNKIRDVSVLSKLPSLKWIDIGFNGIYDISSVMNADFDIQQLSVRANFLDLTEGGRTKVWLDKLATKPIYLSSVGGTVTGNTAFYDSQQQNELWYYEWSDLTDRTFDSRSLVVGDSIPAKIIARYVDYNDQVIDNSSEWVSSDPKVLMIKNGKITALKSGYASIKIKWGDVEKNVWFNVISRPNMGYYYSKALTDTMKAQLQNALVLGVGNGTILADGTLETTDAKPFVDKASASTLLPVRVVSENLESSVTWDKKTQTAVVTNYDGSIRIEIRIGEKTMKVNDKVVDLPVAARIVDSNTYLPLRALCDALGKQITYHNGVIAIANHSFYKEAELLNTLSKMYSLKE